MRPEDVVLACCCCLSFIAQCGSFSIPWVNDQRKSAFSFKCAVRSSLPASLAHPRMDFPEVKSRFFIQTRRARKNNVCGARMAGESKNAAGQRRGGPPRPLTHEEMEAAKRWITPEIQAQFTLSDGTVDYKVGCRTMSAFLEGRQQATTYIYADRKRKTKAA
jgi:hypothetical protein